ncbi:MAG: DUF302 domain-containing protein [Desulfuromonadales bacterium]|nr:DUF302 domain-containing protein [Desulfuromonadales bacterium]MBN2791033.1 DUF302 domain-containing protein [Desulfuromonadales bacterium]
MPSNVYSAQTDKSIADFIKDLGRSMTMYGFIIHNEDRMEMVHHFGHHGVELAADFDLHMVQVCAPKRSAESLQKNLERAVLLPKFIVVFSKSGQTQVRMLRLSGSTLHDLVDDDEFPQLQAAICDDLQNAIESAL